MGFFDKMKNMMGVEDDYYDDYSSDYDSQEGSQEVDYSASSYQPSPASGSYSSNNYSGSYDNSADSSDSNVVRMPSLGSSGKVRISIQEPLQYEDGPQVIDAISQSHTVVLNLEMLEVDKKRQIFDFVSGGVYALHGDIEKVTKDIYVIVPKGVSVDSKLAETVAKGTGSLYQL